MRTECLRAQRDAFSRRRRRAGGHSAMASSRVVRNQQQRVIRRVDNAGGQHVAERPVGIRPPRRVVRTPRSIDTHRRKILGGAGNGFLTVGQIHRLGQVEHRAVRQAASAPESPVRPCRRRHAGDRSRPVVIARDEIDSARHHRLGGKFHLDAVSKMPRDDRFGRGQEDERRRHGTEKQARQYGRCESDAALRSKARHGRPGFIFRGETRS